MRQDLALLPQLLLPLLLLQLLLLPYAQPVRARPAVLSLSWPWLLVRGAWSAGGLS